MSPFIARLLTLLVLGVLVIFSFAPVPGTTLIMLYVVLFRPRWFKHLVDLIYEEITTTDQKKNKDTRSEPPDSVPASSVRMKGDDH